MSYIDLVAFTSDFEFAAVSPFSTNIVISPHSMANRILNFVLCPLLQIKGGFEVKILSNLNLFKKKFDGFGLFWEGVLITLTFLLH